MKERLTAFFLSLVLAVSFAPGLALAEPADGLSVAGAVGALEGQGLEQQAVKAPKVKLTRVTTGSLAVQVGASYKLGAKTSAGTLTFKSSNKKVAVVSSKGVVKAKKAGKVTITVTAKYGSKKTVKKVPLRVFLAKKYKAVKKLRAKASATSLAQGATAKVKVSFLPLKPSNKNVVYKSSNPEVLTVSATGKVKALKMGKAKVTVTSCDNAKVKASVTIKVKSSPVLSRSKWKARMNLPTFKQMSTYKAPDRSPYLVCWPQFGDMAGYTEYAVDFKADSQPRGTYVNVGNWWMNTDTLKKRYSSVATDDGDTPGCMYAGFQVLDDGRKVAIMSGWKIFLTDKNGKESTLDVKRTYPEKPSIAGDFDGEGTGVKTLVDYDWQAGKTYRALIQCGKTKEGNCEITFKVCDLETGKWTKLVSYDLGYENTYMMNVGCFLENYHYGYATEVRTAEWSNYRVKPVGKDSWVSAKSAKMERQFQEWPGSYNYGSSGSCFWAVTSGVPNLCKPPKDGKLFYVTKAAQGNPTK